MRFSIHVWQRADCSITIAVLVGVTPRSGLIELCTIQ
jgi:hypothetical protein